jgi:hypothetical protein
VDFCVFLMEESGELECCERDVIVRRVGVEI